MENVFSLKRGGRAALLAAIAAAIVIGLGLAFRPSSTPEPVAVEPPSLTLEQVQAKWQDDLVAHLARFQHYPSFARTFNEEGTVMLRFTMDREGNVLDSSVDKSSDSLLLDEEAVNMLDRAQPLPKFPPEMTADQLELILPVRFSLN